MGDPVEGRDEPISRAHRVSMPGACDCHVHVFEPARFGYVLPRTYTPGAAPLADLQHMLTHAGLDRVVVVQPSAYGTDNRCLLDALRRLGTQCARGVAVVDIDRTTDQELEALISGGVRGLRLNLEVRGERNAGSAARQLKRARDLVLGSGLALQLYADIAVVEVLADDIATAGVPIVLDHFGGLRADRGPEQAGLTTLLALVRERLVYVKLSAPYRTGSAGPDYAEAGLLARALVAAGPGQLMWGSDWPHTGSSSNRSGDLSRIEPFRAEDAGRTLDLLADWVPDKEVRRQILVDNPAALFGFSLDIPRKDLQ